MNGLTKLLAYLGKVRIGNSRIVDTPFAKGESTANLLSNWDKTLKTIRDKWPSLYQFETDMAGKVGPLSYQKPLKDRVGDIMAYYDGILLPSRPILSRAVEAACSEWKSTRGLRMKSQQSAWDGTKTKSTNAGNPTFNKRRNVIDKTLPITNISKEDYTLDGQTWPFTAVLGWRGQEGGPLPSDVKQRVVWMFPLGVNILEAMVYQPLEAAAQMKQIVPAWVSMECVDRRITQLFDTKAPDDLVICTDFTKFDQHFNTSLQDSARRQIRYIFRACEEMDDWLDDIFDIKYRIPLVVDSGKILHGHHGMGSGSGGTNADETLAHRSLQFEAAILNGQRLNPNSQCLGDDGILSYPGITVDQVVQAYTSHGLEMNESKQYASTHDCVYLRRWHDLNYRVNGICAGVYSTNRALGRLRYMERFMDPKIWGPKMVALRQLSIIENCQFHPLFEQFVDFCMKRDKYRLGIDIPGFLDNLPTLAQEANEHMPDFLGYTKALGKDNPGIENWRVVKYLKSKR